MSPMGAAQLFVPSLYHFVKLCVLTFEYNLCIYSCGVASEDKIPLTGRKQELYSNP